MPTNIILEEYNSCKICLDKEPSVGISGSKCAVCKGRLMCGINPCPVLSSITVKRHDGMEAKKNVQGKAQNLSIEWERFPNGLMGPLILDEDYDPNRQFDNVRERMLYKLSNIYCPQITGGTNEEVMDDLSKIALSEKPVEIEASFSARPQEKAIFSSVDRALNNCGELEAIEVFGDPKIPLYLIDILEKDIGHRQAVIEAFRNEADIEYISKLLSMGCLSKPQKMLPTRWAKTTVYSLCSQQLIRKVKRLPVSQEPAVYHQNYLGNDYVILALARHWEFELMERWLPNSVWTVGESDPVYVHEHETYNSASDQAMREGGSYYASRLGVCELLIREGIQGACLVLSTPSPSSSVPFGSGENMMGISGAELVGKFDNEKEAIDKACSMCGLAPRKLSGISMMLSQNTLNRWM